MMNFLHCTSEIGGKQAVLVQGEKERYNQAMPHMNPTFIKPRYDSGGFASLPACVENAFASGDYDAVILFLIDGFGWRFFERFQDEPFIKHVAKHGKIEKLISQFPSTTAAHVTTIHTGLNVGQSGVHEWIYYEPQLDMTITPLLFSHAGTKERDTLKRKKVQPESLYPQGRLYPALRRLGVTPYMFGSREHTPSTFSNVVMDGAEQRPFKTLSEAFVNIGLLLEKQTHPIYVHLYFDKFDALCHEYGPNSAQAEAEIRTVLWMMDQYFSGRLIGGKKRVLFLMTADHGFAEVNPQTTTYLNTHPDFKGFEKFIRANRKGRLLVPAGSARDMFLYIHDEMLDEAQSFLAKRLAGRADVVRTEALIADGYFGDDVSQRFLARVGNLVVLSYLNESVWWYEKDKFEMKYYGHHGGLTPQEMETVLYSLETDPR